MTTLWESGDATETGPAVHALVLGVGGYDWLYGGRRHVPRRRGDKLSRKMRQLTSPPASARAFCSVLQDRLSKHSGPPLGSIEAVISEAHGPSDTHLGAGRANLADVQEAFGTWYDRCDSHPENIALFFFCGHGVQLGAHGDHALLLQDTGQDPHHYFQNAIDIGHTIRNMRANRASIQCYFIDACRDSHDLDLDYETLNATPLGESRVRDREPEQLVVLSTSAGAAAYGDPDRPTVFTQAVLRALFSPQASNSDDDWHVTTTSIGPAVNGLMRWPGLSADVPAEQQCLITGQVRGGTLFRFTESPGVPFHFDTDPPGPGEVQVEFADGPYAATRQDVWLQPPCYGRTLKVDAQ
jgi:Caspase domain